MKVYKDTNMKMFSPYVILDLLQSFLHFFCRSLSLPVAVFVSLIPFHCFTTETTGKLWLSQCNMIHSSRIFG